jgi:hypothetical protein
MPFVNPDGVEIAPRTRIIDPDNRRYLKATDFLHWIESAKKPYQKRAIASLKKGLDKADDGNYLGAIATLKRTIHICNNDPRFKCIQNLAEIYRDAETVADTTIALNADSLEDRQLIQVSVEAFQDRLWFGSLYLIPFECTIG